MKRTISLAIVLGLFVLQGPGHATAAGDDTWRALDLFGDVFERLRSDYVEEVSDSDLIEAAIEGMLGSLDPHSSYYSPDAYAEAQVQTTGEFGGLGIEVTMENGFVKVVAPIDDTPAQRAGIKAGDFVTHLDEEPLLGLTLNEAVDKLRGPPDSEITLTIAREGVDEPITFTIIRAIITIQSVRWRLEKKVGYVRITSFTQQTQGGVDDAMEAIEDAAAGDLQGIVLDLRNNPGGLLDQAISVADSFLEQGEIVSTRGRREGDAQRFHSKSGDLAEGLPIVVLINGGSASGSEIVAGALQDHRRAIIMGTQSFGKGSVQSFMPLASGGAMRLTTARYYTPSGMSIQGTGISPDIIVEEAVIQSSGVERFGEADLVNSLDAGNAVPSEEEDEDTSFRRSEQALGDYQLSRALDLIEGIALASR